MQITIPKEGTTIVFAPSGIKTPSRAQAAGHGKPAVQVRLGVVASGTGVAEGDGHGSADEAGQGLLHGRDGKGAPQGIPTSSSV